MLSNIKRFDDYNEYNEYYDNDFTYLSDDDSLLISRIRRQARAPIPFNLPSLKKERENKENEKKEKEKQENFKNKVETFRKSQKTGIWGRPGWLVQDIDIPAIMAAKEQLQNDLATGVIVIIPNEEKKVEEVKIEKKESVRDGAFEVLSNKEKMKGVFEKTELCVSVTNGVLCPHGDKCRFLHDAALWKPRKCNFEDSCRCVKFISKPDGSFYLVNNGIKVCKFIHGGESRENFHRRTKIPNPVSKKVEIVPTSIPKKKEVCKEVCKEVSGKVCKEVSGEVTKPNKPIIPKFTWARITYQPVVSTPQPVVSTSQPVVSTPQPVVSTSQPVVSTPKPVFNWSQMSKQLKSEGISLIAKKPDVTEWITPKSKSQKRNDKKEEVACSNNINTMTSLCRSVIMESKCTHAVCRFAHDVEKIVLRNCCFDACRKVVCVSGENINGYVYKNVGRNICNYLHTEETRESYYKRLDIFKFKK
jgi:hypothetical protein